MSCLFAGADRLDYASDIIGGYPFSIVCWVKASAGMVGNGADKIIWANFDASDVLHRFMTKFDGGTDNIQETVEAGGAEAIAALPTSSWSDSDWSPIITVETSATNHYVRDKDDTATSSVTKTPLAIDRFRIGNHPTASTNEAWDGSIALFAIFAGYSLSTAEKDAARVVHPKHINPSKLTHFWRLSGADDLICQITGLALTNTGVTSTVDMPSLATGPGARIIS